MFYESIRVMICIRKDVGRVRDLIKEIEWSDVETQISDHVPLNLLPGYNTDNYIQLHYQLSFGITVTPVVDTGYCLYNLQRWLMRENSCEYTHEAIIQTTDFILW